MRILKNTNVVQLPQLLDQDLADFNGGYTVTLICDEFVWFSNDIRGIYGGIYVSLFSIGTTRFAWLFVVSPRTGHNGDSIVVI